MNSVIQNENDKKFVELFKIIQTRAYDVNRANGWWEKRERITKILADHGIDFSPHLVIELSGLIGTEVSEGIEAARKQDPSTWGDVKTPHTLVRECAGAIVRMSDMCEHFHLDLGAAIIEEIKQNQGRGHMHGNNVA